MIAVIITMITFDLIKIIVLTKLYEYCYCYVYCYEHCYEHCYFHICV